MQQQDQYFNENTEKNILEWIRTKDSFLFQKEIAPKLRQLILGIVGKKQIWKNFPNSNIYILMDECFCLLSEILWRNYDKSKGKAYSYLTTSCINFFFQARVKKEIKKKYKNIIQDWQTTNSDQESDILWDKLRKLYKKRDKYSKREQELLEVANYLLLNRTTMSDSPLFGGIGSGKKASFAVLRTLTGWNTKQLNTVLDKLRKRRNEK